MAGIENDSGGMMATTIQPLVKNAETRYPINDLLRRRWSSRAFADEPVGDEVLGSLFEAARWAPSTGNGQPWSFVVAVRGREPVGGTARARGRPTRAEAAGVVRLRRALRRNI